MYPKREINISEKQGFFSPGDIDIFDENGVSFYRKNGKNINFNLPPGKYISKNDVSPAQFVEYVLPELPPREKNRGKEKPIKIYKKENPAKASIFINSGKIIIDPKFFYGKKYIKVFILLHEIGHFYYSTEKYCDTFAARVMLINGYNPSQVMNAINETLDSVDRKKELIFKILQ